MRASPPMARTSSTRRRGKRRRRRCSSCRRTRPEGARCSENATLLAVSRTGEVAIALNPARPTPFLTPGTLARGSMTGGAPKPEIENVLAADYAPDGSLAIVRVHSRRSAGVSSNSPSEQCFSAAS